VARDFLNLDSPVRGRFGARSLDLLDLEAVRLILQGSSVIDWHRLNFTNRSDVDAFLRLHLMDPGNPEDHERLRFVFNQSVNYLEENLDLRFPEDLRMPDDVRDIFVEASTFAGRFRRRQMLACTTLKLMHVINHMEAADLKFQTAVSEARLLDKAEKRIIEYADALRSQGYPLVAFYGSRKTRNSVITKLLAKRETIAATVFDKLRFRLVVESQTELVPVVAHLCRTLFPFNYAIPGQSHNNLVNFRRNLKENPDYASKAVDLQRLRSRASEWIADNNPFSGNSYRTINFIVDFPVRLDEEHPFPDHPYLLGRVVFVMVEIQVLDQETALANEDGDNAHDLYKDRQRRIVERRLMRGAKTRPQQD
jgi:uncharacterized protein (TIGR04552 family)